MLSFCCQKKSLSLSILLLLEVLYREELDHIFFFVKHVCSQDYGLVGTSRFSVYRRNSLRGLCFKKECQQLQFCGSCSYNEVLRDLRKPFLDMFYKCLVDSRGKCTKKLKFQLRNIPIQSPLTNRALFIKKFLRFF